MFLEKVMEEVNQKWKKFIKTKELTPTTTLLLQSISFLDYENKFDEKEDDYQSIVTFSVDNHIYQLRDWQDVYYLNEKEITDEFFIFLTDLLYDHQEFDISFYATSIVAAKELDEQLTFKLEHSSWSSLVKKIKIY